MRNFILFNTLLLLHCSMVVLPRASIAEGLLMVGLSKSDMNWAIYSTRKGEDWKTISTIDEPRTPVFNSVKNLLAYVDSGGNVRLIKNDVETVILPASQSVSYTQPAFDHDGNHLFVVALKDGASVDTDIMKLHIDTGEITPIVKQRSAQFEPAYAGETLFYSSVSCVPPACHRIIEDIWKISPVSLEAEQLTMLNAISREPTIDNKNDTIYFISDKSGQLSLWSLSAADVKEVIGDSGSGSDSSPAVTESGDVVFIRKSRYESDQLLSWSSDKNTTIKIGIPQPVVKIRDLSTW